MRTLVKSTLGLAAAVGMVACAPSAGIGSREPGTLRAGLSVGLQAQSDGSGGGRGGNLVNDMDQIVVSVSAVAAHAAGGGWVSVSEAPAIVDLLRLQDHADELGFANLPEGKITQIRLYIADDGVSHTVSKAGETRLLTIPSGLQTGVKLKGPFDLGECEYGNAVGILDLEKSILVHGRGNHEDLILRPTIHRTDYVAVPADICEPGEPGGEIPPGEPGDGTDVPPGGDGGDGSDGECPPNTEGCTPGVPVDGSDDGTDGAGDGTGDGTGDGSGDGTDGAGDGTGTGTGDGTDGAGDGTGTGTGDGTDGAGDGTGTGTGTDTGDECAPILTEAGLINPCG